VLTHSVQKQTLKLGIIKNHQYPRRL